MFFSTELLTKKRGGYAIIWMSANFGTKGQLKKLSKRDIMAQNLSKLCEGITVPDEPLALRLSATLLLGVARVYSQQWHLLQSDVQEAQNRIKKAFVDLYPVEGHAAVGARPASLEMENPKATRAAITRATPMPDTQGFWLDLDQYAYGPAYMTADDSGLQDISGIVIRGLEQIAEEDESDRIDNDQDATIHRPEDSNTGGEVFGQRKAKNVATDDRLINLDEFDLDEPLDRQPGQSASGIDLGFGDFDLDLDIDFGDPGGPRNDSLVDREAHFRENSQEFMQDLDGGDALGLDLDFDAPLTNSASMQIDEPIADTSTIADSKLYSKRPTPGARSDEERSDTTRKKRKLLRGKVAGSGQVDEVIVMAEELVRPTDRHQALQKIRADIAKAHINRRKTILAALAQRMIFAAPQEQLNNFWKAHVALLTESDKNRASKLSTSKERKRGPDGPLSPLPEAELGRGGPQDFDTNWSFMPDDGEGAAGHAQRTSGGYEAEVDFEDRRFSSLDIEVGRGDDQAGRLSDIMPWEVFASARDSGIFDSRHSMHPDSRNSLASSHPDTPINYHVGHHSSTPLRINQTDVPSDSLQMPIDDDLGDFGFKQSDIARAGLSQQAADFYDYSRRQSTAGSLLFSDIAPVTTSSATIAAAAFYHVLTLAGKGLFHVTGQQGPYGEIRLEVVHLDD